MVTSALTLALVFFITPAAFAAGQLLWHAQFDRAAGADAATDVAAAAGRVAVTGSGETATGSAGLVVRVHNARTGALIWSDTVDVRGGSAEGSGLVIDAKRVIVAGTSIDSAGVRRGVLRATWLYEPMRASSG